MANAPCRSDKDASPEERKSSSTAVLEDNKIIENGPVSGDDPLIIETN
jgi:hypothetical protein